MKEIVDTFSCDFKCLNEESWKSLGLEMSHKTEFRIIWTNGSLYAASDPSDQ